MSLVLVAAAIKKTNLLPREPALVQSWELNNNPVEQHSSRRAPAPWCALNLPPDLSSSLAQGCWSWGWEQMP